jgi:hypothetical protein
MDLQGVLSLRALELLIPRAAGSMDDATRSVDNCSELQATGRMGIMKILLAKDSAFRRIAMERVLGKAGHQVTSVGDGQRAVRVATESVLDLCIVGDDAAKPYRPGGSRRTKTEFCYKVYSSGRFDQPLAEE